METPRYKRVLIKLSGEALMGDESFGISPEMIKYMAEEVGAVARMGVQVAVVVGGGNIFRGVKASSFGMDRTAADHMGMLATVINSIALQDAIEKAGFETRIQTAIEMHAVAEPYILRRALRHLDKGRIVIFAAGTGNPYFTTDTAAVLRAEEIHAEIFLKATRVNGLYDSDPEKSRNASFIKRTTYMHILEKQLGVMDSTAISLAMDNSLPLVVFSIKEPGNLQRIICGEDIGTLIVRE